MNAKQFKKIRETLELTPVELARALAYDGTDETVTRYIRAFETGGREVPPRVARLMTMFKRHGVPKGWTS